MNNQIIQNQIEELKELINNVNNKFLELQEDIKESKKKSWIPDIGDKYYFIDKCKEIDEHTWNNDEIDKFFLSIDNVYQTKEEAKAIGFRKVFEQQLFTRLRKFADEKNEAKIDWNNHDQYKYYIYYDYRSKKLKIKFNQYYKTFQQDIYFTSSNIAKEAVKDFEDDLIKYYEI